jgi:cytochrome c peroxidase
MLGLLLLAACDARISEPARAQVLRSPFSPAAAPADGERALAPLPQSVALDSAKVALGKRLWSDPRLSGDGRVACSHCHVFARGGADGIGHVQLPGRTHVPVNVPSVFNAAFDFRFGWSGRFADIGAILDVAIESPAVMASSWHMAADTLLRDASLLQAFSALYADALAPNNLREVLALYVLSLITPNARFDRHLRGELALSADEEAGYALFRDYGCISCHQGINVGGNLLARFGVVADYFAQRGDPTPADQGLFSATQREEDRFVFRVPSLRNVALTAPYFHDASAATLDDAIRTMARFQLGRSLSAQQTDQIAAFLRTLSGELDGVAL